MARYDSRTVLNNSSRFYREILDQRGVKRIKQYNTPYMSYPSPEEISKTIDRVSHLWKTTVHPLFFEKGVFRTTVQFMAGLTAFGNHSKCSP